MRSRGRYVPVYEGDVERIQLGDGSVTVKVDVDLFALSDDDRQFVFDLVDRVRQRRDAS